ncbi:galactose oxidase [Periconia macrospinosa]|uniref:Galactose oxidase n=1 Tax=Periconia macrospinosa TaxID=97972 RepID=A0A2V1D8T0_9PLEO|nr:galactose oxidase [Periconia macrospinosa]
MIKSTLIQALSASSLLVTLASATLTSCPGEETSWSTGAGQLYTTCPNSDYTHGGRSLQIVNNVQNCQACVEICSKDTRCRRAVYDKQGKICHVKDERNSMWWETDSRFDAIRLDTEIKDRTPISACLVQQTTYRAPKGATYNMCTGSDYEGGSAKIFRQVTTSNACADLCSTTNGCKKAVFDHQDNVCHIKKAEPATLVWVKNKRFSTITLPTTSNTATQGKWSDIVRLPLIPVAAYVVPKFPQPDSLMYFSSWGVDAFGGASGMTQFGGLDLNSGAVSHREVVNTNHDMFCPAISQLADGRILIQGGSDAEAVSIYDPATNNFTRAADMTVGRGYQTSTILSNGKVFTIGGAYSGPRKGKNGEIYDPETELWTYLPNADVKPILTTDHEGIWREDNHAWLFGWKDGSVFQAGPGVDQHWFGTEGEGSIVKAGTRDTDDAMCGIFVMYDAVNGKILSAGGSPDYTNSAANKRAHITTIGEPNTPSTIERVSDMSFQRGFSNAVVLPDGTVLVTGGQKKSLVFTNTDGVLIPELFNPETKQWTQLAASAVPRNYHSISILLPDSRVFVGGGGLCWVSKIRGSTAGCDKTVDHADGEFYEPPFLFNADGTYAKRPIIAGLPQESVKVGATLNFRVTELADGEKAKVSLIRMGSVTHSVNSDQRRIPLEDLTVNGGQYSAQLPTDSGILLPGYYYLFAMSSTGTPSIGQTVHVVL